MSSITINADDVGKLERLARNMAKKTPAAEAPAEESAGVGHNSGGIAGDRLRSFIERIERLEDEKKDLQGDIKDIYAEAKGVGFDTKIMREIVRLRRMEKEDREEQAALRDLYLDALGML